MRAKMIVFLVTAGLILAQIVYGFRQKQTALHPTTGIPASPPGARLKTVVTMFPNGWPLRGLAAADESGGTRVPDTDDIGDAETPPDGLTLVPVVGNSMSPVLLDGQCAMIDTEREGFETDGGIYVAHVSDPGDGDRREAMTGTFVKRCYKGDGVYYFTSINTYSPFDAWQDHCRLWPVLGVWFRGRGSVPKWFG